MTGLLRKRIMLPLASALALWSWIASVKSSMVDDLILPVAGSWAALIPPIAIMSATIALLCVRATALAPSDRKPEWKSFWNVVEIFWLLGTISFIGSITAAAPALTSLIAENYADQIRQGDATISTRATHLVGRLCANAADEPAVCPILNRLQHAGLDPDHVRTAIALQEARRHMQPMRQADRLITEQLDRLTGDLWETAELHGLRAKEPKGPLLGSGVRWFNIFAPLLFTALFPMRLGRAFAAFWL